MQNLLEAIKSLIGGGGGDLIDPQYGSYSARKRAESERVLNESMIKAGFVPDNNGGYTSPSKIEKLKKPDISPKQKTVGRPPDQDVKTFLENVVLPITNQYGIPSAVAAGQLAAEGRLRGLGWSRNNPYNIGAFDNNLDNTYQYPTVEKGIEAYAKLLSSDPRYSQAYGLRQDPLKMLEAIQNAGYAGDPKTYQERAENNYPSYSSFIKNTPEWRSYFR